MNRKLKRVKHIPNDLLDTCFQNDVFYVKDVLGKTTVDLLAILDIPLEDIEILIDKICKSICPQPKSVCNNYFVHT